jgi:hypothetical protein
VADPGYEANPTEKKLMNRKEEIIKADRILTLSDVS